MATIKGQGNPNSGIYCLGDINVATPGTPAPLNQNVSTDSNFGTSATPSPMQANQVWFQSLAANTGTSYVIMGAGNSKTSPANGGAIVKRLAPGEFFVMGLGNISNPYQLKQFVIDADTGGNKVNVVALNV